MNSFGPTMSTASSSVVYDQFPAGLRVLVVDDDPTCLLILEKMLRTCLYEVTKCSQAETALSLLRENRNGYDIVLSDVHMPDMDGFRLLEHIGLEMDLPVIMMSADDGKDVVMKGVTHGACDYLIKPIRIEALKNIWQHVVRKRKNGWKDYDQTGSAEEGDRQSKQAEDAEYSSSANEGNWKSSKRRKDDEEETDERDDTSTLKKQRVVWSVELHQQFVAAVNQLGTDKAVPKKILELMNVPGLTRENVASHLQKYRLYLRRLSGVSQHHNEISDSFIHPQEARQDPLSSLNGLDIQTLVAANQLPAQRLANLQAAGLGQPMANPRIPMHVVDQRNLFKFESQKMRYLDGQQQQGLQQHLGSNNRLNLLHGIPTSMAPKQLAHLNQQAQSLVSMNLPANARGVEGNHSSSSLLMQTLLPQSRAEILNEITSDQVSKLPLSVGHSARIQLSKIDVGAGLAGHNAASQPMNYPLNKSSDLAGNSFALGNPLGMYNHIPKEPIPQAISSEMKGTGGLLPSYDIFSDLHQYKSPELQNLGSTFTGSYQANALQRNLDVGPSILNHQGYCSAGDIIMECMNADATFTKVKTEQAPISNSPSKFFQDQFGQDDLMSAILAQQQGGIRQAEPDFDFDAYNIDNIRV